MKRKYSYISIGVALLLVLSTSSCGDLQIPETVSVKSNARFQAPLGTASYGNEDLESDILSTIQEGLPNASIYPYRMDSNDDVLRYLVRYQLDPIPIPIGSYLDNMKFPENLGGLNRSKEFTAGAPLTFNQEIPFSVSDITSQLADNGNFASEREVLPPGAKFPLSAN